MPGYVLVSKRKKKYERPNRLKRQAENETKTWKKAVRNGLLLLGGWGRERCSERPKLRFFYYYFR